MIVCGQKNAVSITPYLAPGSGINVEVSPLAVREGTAAGDGPFFKPCLQAERRRFLQMLFYGLRSVVQLHDVVQCILKTNKWVKDSS